MNLVIKEIEHAGDLERERVVFNVLKEDNIGFYLLLHTGATDEGKATGRVKGTFWFPDRKVKGNDLVVLYTKAGYSRRGINADGTSTYFYYRGLREAVLKKSNSAVVLLKATVWQSRALSVGNIENDLAA
ncbi:MAG: hypothetical protein ACLP0A_18380 [Verrucomicrobiia bacterium]